MVKLAAISALGGLLLAVALASAKRPPSNPTIDPDMVEVEDVPSGSRAEFKRCRTITEPDPACDALWEAQRRRFFHGKD